MIVTGEGSAHSSRPKPPAEDAYAAALARASARGSDGGGRCSDDDGDDNEVPPAAVDGAVLSDEACGGA